MKQQFVEDKDKDRKDIRRFNYTNNQTHDNKMQLDNVFSRLEPIEDLDFRYVVQLVISISLKT